MKVVGIDFSSAPSARKPIVIVTGGIDDATDGATDGATARLCIDGAEGLESLAAFEAWLHVRRDWVAGCDFPFGLPRAFIEAQGWAALDWSAIVDRVAGLSRTELVDRCRSYAAARPAGAKFAHRATDRPAGSSPSMKWVNPPVVLMLHAGVPRLVAAGVSLPGLRAGDSRRVALEAYPGLLARIVLGRVSYKSDDPRRDDAPRRAARERLLGFLESGAMTRIRVVLDPSLRRHCLDDFRGDHLDAVLCAVQAAWGFVRRDAGWDLPADLDPLEGWIIGAGRLLPCRAAEAPGS